jgi:hypothetical protein
MMIVHPTSLSDTLDSAAEIIFNQKTILPSQRSDLAAMLTSRQIQSEPNSGYFLPFTSESGTQATLFTGEPLHNEFASHNIQLIEAARLLVLIAIDDPDSVRSIRLADRRMNMLCYSSFCAKGECKSLTIAYMRYLIASKTEAAAIRLDQLLTKLAAYRDGKGKWQGFPFYYTLLMLSESKSHEAANEIEYSASFFNRLRKQEWSKERFSNRCQSIQHRIISRREQDAYPLLLGEYG